MTQQPPLTQSLSSHLQLSDVKRLNGGYSGAVTYLASSSRGVFAHFVVRVVVMALESAPADATESSNSSTKQRSLILKLYT